jgi:hypothetical protein
MAGLMLSFLGLAAAEEPRRWTDDELVASYRDLAAAGTLADAIRRPKMPSDPPQAAFLDALAWFAAGTPDAPGTLTLGKLDAFIDGQADAYAKLLKARVEGAEENDYPRTRTWKVIQKLTMLREAMAAPARGGSYAYPAFDMAPREADAWETEHTLVSTAEFESKVCRASEQRPVLVKYGNTNCTQCMLFEMIGSVKDLAGSPALKGSVDVYKVWFGFEPDGSFEGRIRNPVRLDDLAKAEGVRSSPTFIAYRHGRRYPCGDGFPDGRGAEAHLEACLAKASGEAPLASVCGSQATASGPSGGLAP